MKVNARCRICARLPRHERLALAPFGLARDSATFCAQPPPPPPSTALVVAAACPACPVGCRGTTAAASARHLCRRAPHSLRARAARADRVQSGRVLAVARGRAQCRVWVRVRVSFGCVISAADETSIFNFAFMWGLAVFPSEMFCFISHSSIASVYTIFLPPRSNRLVSVCSRNTALVSSPGSGSRTRAFAVSRIRRSLPPFTGCCASAGSTVCPASDRGWLHLGRD